LRAAARRVAAAAAVAVAAATLTGCQKHESSAGHLVLPATSVISTSEQRGIIAADSLRVRAQPSVRAEVLSHFRRGEVVEVLQHGEHEERIDGDVAYWVEVTYEGVRGWAFGSHVDLVAPGTPADQVSERVRATRSHRD
jgi:uncharacterized protein YgiM (DUF1202 family)